jgi:adenylate cyclase
MPEDKFKRKLTTIFSTDVAGYSRLMGDDEAATVKTLEHYKGIMSELIRQHRGRVVDSPGDNLLAEFTSVVDAVQCAVATQKELQARNAELRENRRMQFRIGVNLGDVIEEESRIYGDGVNIAARLESLSDPGGICISKTAFDQIETKLPLGYDYLGEQTVKNISKPVGAYRVLMEPRVTVAGKKVTTPKSLISRKLIYAGAFMSLVVAIGAGIWHQYFREKPVPMEKASVEKMALPLPDKPSIAVLPFVNMSSDLQQDVLSDGLTEDIITTLSKVPNLFVIARNSSSTYKGKAVKVQQVAEDLGVRYVLEGSIQKSGERLRVTAQLIDALKGYHVWSEKYEKIMGDLFAIQDNITLNIAVAMQVEIVEGEQARVRHKTNNLEAWTLAVKAHGLFETYIKDENAKARELFKKAVELDPAYAYAWAYLGWTYWIDGRWYSMYYDQDEAFRIANELAEKALSLDNKSPDAYALLSSVYLTQRKYDEAVAAGIKAIELSPNSSENHAIVAITMESVGDSNAVISLIKKAMRLDPNYPPWYIYMLGVGYRMQENYEDSAKAFIKRIEIAEKAKKPASAWGVYLALASTYSMQGRLEEAKSQVAKAIELNPKITAGSYGNSFMYKNPAKVEEILDALRRAGLPE